MERSDIVLLDQKETCLTDRYSAIKIEKKGNEDEHN